MTSEDRSQIKDLGLSGGEEVQASPTTEENLHMEVQGGTDSGHERKTPLDLLGPTVSSLLEGLTVQHRRRLEFGSPSVATKLLLAELLLDVVRLVSNHLLESFNGAPVTSPDEEIESRLWNILLQIFSAVVDVDFEDQTSSSRSLVALLVKEIKKNTNCFSPAGDHVAVVALNQCNTRCETVDVMLQQATAVLAERMRRAKESLPGGQRKTKWVTFAPSVEVGSCVVAPAEELTFRDRLVSASRKTLQRILMKEVEEVIHPLLEDEEFQQLLSRTRPEVNTMSDQISQFLTENLVSSTARPDSATFPGSREQMKTFFTVCFYRAWILHLLPKLRKRFDLRNKRVRSLQPLIDDIDALLVKEDRTSVSFLLVLTRKLSDLIYSHVSFKAPTHSSSELYADIQYRVQVFMLLAKWWWKTQAEVQGERVCHSLSEIQLTVLFPSLVPEEASVPAGRKAAVVEVLVEKLVSHLFKKVKYQERMDDLYTVVQDVFQAVWAELESAQVDFTPELLHDLEKSVVRELCCFQGAKKVLQMVLHGKEGVAGSVKDQMTRPQRKHKDGGKLRSLGKSIAKRFREKVSVKKTSS